MDGKIGDNVIYYNKTDRICQERKKKKKKDKTTEQ
jgi:hypothetical protein